MQSLRAKGVPALAGALGIAALLLGGCGGGGGTTTPEGVVSVRSTPAGAQILIGGQSTQQVTPATIRVPVVEAGSQVEVVLRLESYDDARQVVTVLPGQTVTVDLTLLPSQPPSIPPHTVTGKVELAGGTPAADAAVTATETTTSEVFTAVFDTAAARAGTYYLFAPPGTYSVTASRSGYQPQTRTLTLISGEDRQTGVDFTLSP